MEDRTFQKEGRRESMRKSELGKGLGVVFPSWKQGQCGWSIGSRGKKDREEQVRTSTRAVFSDFNFIINAIGSH